MQAQTIDTLHTVEGLVAQFPHLSEFDAAHVLYYWLSDNCGDQGRGEYAALCQLGYKPGAFERGLDPTFASEYEFLSKDAGRA